MIHHSNSHSFGALLNVFRKRKNLTQQQLARIIGVHRNAISRWEQGDFLPESKRKVLELVKALQLDASEGRHLLEASFTALAPLWNVPYPRNPFFTGRKEILDSLHQCLNASQAIALTQSYALHGLGGIGKTQLAVEYAYRYELEYTATLWIQAETNENIIASFLTIAELLHLPQSQETNQQRIVDGVQRWLTSQNGWLLIWDNLEDMELLHRYLPPAHQGAILVTTRCQSLGTLVQDIKLPPMAQEEGVLFLLRRAKILSQQATSDQVQQLARQQPTEYAAAEELVKVMGGLPLALDQVGAYVEETACGINSYLILYREQYKHLLNRRGKHAGSHPLSTTATLLLAYERVKQAHVAAADLICLCTFLHPDAIPEELLRAGAAFLGTTLHAVASNPYQLDQAIAILRTYSLVNRSSETHTLTIHRLVQTVLKEHMDTLTFQQWSERTVQVLNAAFPSGGETETWPQCQRYLAHVEVCSLFIEQWKLTSPEAGQLLHRAGVYSRMRAQYAQAEQWLSQAQMIRQQMRGDEHIETAESLNELAIVYRSQGKYAEARPLFQRALTIREHQLGTEHLDVAGSLNGLARLYADQGKYTEAEPLYLRALAIQEHLVGTEHPDTAETLNNLAGLYWGQGRYKEAEPLFLRALQIWEHQLGAEHPHVARSLNNLAMVYASWGRYAEAEPLFQRTAGIWERQLGAEHPTTALIFDNLATIYADQGKYTEAEPLYLRALAIREHLLGTEHPHIAHNLNGLAKLYADQGKYTEAEPLYLRALAIQEHLLGTEHPHVAGSLNGLATLYADQGKYTEAEPLYLRALAIREHQLGTEHPDIAGSLNGLATLYADQGKCTEAEPLYLRALAIREHQLGTEHPDTVTTLTRLKSLYAAKN